MELTYAQKKEWANVVIGILEESMKLLETNVHKPNEVRPFVVKRSFEELDKLNFTEENVNFIKKIRTVDSVTLNKMKFDPSIWIQLMDVSHTHSYKLFDSLTNIDIDSVKQSYESLQETIDSREFVDTLRN